MSKDGGSAFPRSAGWNGLSSHEEHSSNEAETGMSLRDYFAARALQGFCTTLKSQGITPGDALPAFLATMAYNMADAMLKERG